MIEGQEVERKRVAKDLHDGLGGLLATVKARLSAEAPAAAASNQLIDRACTEVRRIAHNMMPQTLALSGFSGSVRDIVAQLNHRGLDTELEIIGQPDLRLDEDGQAMLLRILQELTHNVVKHAEAEKLFIQLLDQPNQLLLTVEDDGKGFNADYVRLEKKGIGLDNIASRVAYLRGDIQYDSSPGHGTTVTLTLPL
jgi:signal transduction histidine kinase